MVAFFYFGGNDMALSPRLHAIAALVPVGSAVADVGCDHGYLPVWLLQQGISPFVIATDVAAGPLEVARRSARNAEIYTEISFRLADGLSAVSPFEVEVIVIAGMGGETISSIIAAASWLSEGAHRLILQPQSKVPELMEFLAASGYRVLDQHLVEDGGRLYTIIEAAPGYMDLPRGETCYIIPRLLERGDPLLERYLTEIIEKLHRVLRGLARSADGAERRTELTEDIQRLERWKGRQNHE